MDLAVLRSGSIRKPVHKCESLNGNALRGSAFGLVEWRVDAVLARV